MKIEEDKQMERFNSSKHNELILGMPFSYISTAVYLDFCAWVLVVNDEKLVVKQDIFYKHDFPSLFLPRNSANWEFMSASMISKDDIKKVEDSGVEIKTFKATETEFIYSTEKLMSPATGHKRQIDGFKNNCKYKIFDSYDKKKILTFNNLWQNQKSELDNVFIGESNDFFHFCLHNLDKYNIQQIYVEVGGKLIGFVWGVLHSKDKWVNLHVKVDYKYKGLSQFLNHEIAKKFFDIKICSLGSGCRNEGLIGYKRNLCPIKEKEYFYILTRGKR